MLIPMTPAKTRLVPIVAMNRETNARIIRREGKVSLIAMRIANGRIMLFFFAHLPSNVRFQSPFRRRLREKSGLRRLPCETRVVRAFCVATLAIRSTKKGTRRQVQLLFRQRLRQRAWERKSLLKSALNFVSLCENRPGTTTKYLVRVRVRTVLDVIFKHLYASRGWKV